MRELVPGVTRIAGLQHPGVYSERTMLNMLIDLQERAKESGVEFQAFDASGPNDFEAAFDAMVKAREDALLVFPSPMFYVNYRRLVDLAAVRQLPTMYVFREAVQWGWTDYLSGDAGLDSGIDQVARGFRHRVGGRSTDPERAQSVIIAPHDPKGRLGTVGQLEPTPQEGRHR